MCVCVFVMWATYVRVSDPLDLELQVTVRHLPWTRALWKSSRFSYEPIHRSALSFLSQTCDSVRVCWVCLAGNRRNFLILLSIYRDWNNFEFFVSCSPIFSFKKKSLNLLKEPRAPIIPVNIWVPKPKPQAATSEPLHEGHMTLNSLLGNFHFLLLNCLRARLF